jgi:putative PIN family toxin of toxin-antitoxin system
VGKGKKVVIDTNVFISAFGWGGKPFKIIQVLEVGEIVNCISEDIITEVSKALSYPKLAFPQELQSGILEFIIAHSRFFKSKKSLKVTPDPKDNILIECALSAKARFIITGDKKLLAMKKYGSVKLISPEAFLGRADK